MDADDPNFDSPADDAGGAALDALLCQAAWPEPSPVSTARLAAHWRDLRRTNLRRRVFWAAGGGVGGLAAAAALAVLGKWHLPPTLAPVPGGPTSPVVAVLPPLSEPVRPQIGRPPTLMEAALARRAMEQPPAPPPQPSAERRLEAEVDAAVDELVHQGDGDVTIVLAKLREAAGADRLEEALAGIVADSGGRRREAAGRLLAGIASARSTALLWQLTRESGTRTDALAALRRVTGPEAVEAYERREADLAERRRLLMVASSYCGGLPLADVLVPPQPAPARDDSRTEPATDALFARLADHDVNARLEAARQLARQGDPAVLDRLARMAEANVNRREALIALAASNRSEAEALLDRTAREPGLAGPVRAAVLTVRLR